MKIPNTIIFVLLIALSLTVKGQLTTQKKYATSDIGLNCKTLNLGANGILLYSGLGNCVIRLDNNFDTVWVKLIPDFFINAAIVNASNEIILVGQRGYFQFPNNPNSGAVNFGLQVTKLDINGNLILSKYKFFNTMSVQSGYNKFIRPSIIEYKPNKYILATNRYQNNKFTLIKFDNDFNILEQKFSLLTDNSLTLLLSSNFLVKKNDSEIIVTSNNEFISYGNSFGSSNGFLVIDTSLNNIYHKSLNDSTRGINHISVMGDDLFIGGSMYSNKLIQNQFDNTSFYEFNYLTKLKLTNPSSLSNKSILFCSKYAPRLSSYNQPFFYLSNNSIYCTTSGVNQYSQANNYINDSLSNNFRTRITKLDTSLQVKWNKRLHIYGSKDTSGFQSQFQGISNNTLSSRNVLLSKNDLLINIAIHTSNPNDDKGFSIAAIDTLGNNATCNSTDESLLIKYDSVQLLDKPLFNFISDTNTFQNNIQPILNKPLTKISNVCLPLLPPKSKFFWSAFNSNGFSTIVCKDANLFIFDRSYNEPKTWHWIFPPQANVSELDSLYLPNVQSIFFNQAGVYPVKLVTVNDAGIDTSIQFITVINFIPQPNLGNDTTI